MMPKNEQHKLVNAVRKLPQKISYIPENEENILYYWGGVAKYLEHYFKGKKPPSDYPQWQQEILELSVKRYLAFYDACFFGWEMMEESPIALPFDSPFSALKWLIFIEAEQHGNAPKEQPWRSIRTYAPLRYLHKNNHLPAKERRKAEAALNRIKGEWRERDRGNHQSLYDVLQLLACANSAQDAVKQFLDLDDEMMRLATEYSQHRNQLYRT